MIVPSSLLLDTPDPLVKQIFAEQNTVHETNRFIVKSSSKLFLPFVSAVAISPLSVI